MSARYPWYSDGNFVQKVRSDPLNVNNCRNVRNSDKFGYNCAGYALQCFSWYMPDDDNHPYLFLGWEACDTHVASQRTLEAVEIMLHDFPDQRQVGTLDEVRDDEYAILFRLSSDGDFHFIRQASNNHWFHKMGNTPDINTMRASEIFDIWLDRYNGPIAILAKKRR